MSNPPKKTLPRPGRNNKTIAKPKAEHSLSAGDTKRAEGEQSPANSRHIAILAARAGLEKKATGIEIIDVMGKVDYADYLVLMTGASDRNVAAIAQEVDGELAKAGFRSMAIEGLPAAQWVLIDFVDVVVHVFQRDVRSLYDLDGLWMDAERVPMDTAPVGPVKLPPSLEEHLPPARKTRSGKVGATKPRAPAARKAPAKRTAKAPVKSAQSRTERSATTRSKVQRKSPRTKSES